MIFGKPLKKIYIQEQIDNAAALLPKIKFAWFPVKLVNNVNYSGQWIWLERYIVAGLDRRIIISFETNSTIITNIHINSSLEESAMDMGGWQPVVGEVIRYNKHTAPLLNKPISNSEAGLIVSNLDIVMERWFYKSLQVYISKKVQELIEYDNSK